jgi:hypothetical protein
MRFSGRFYRGAAVCSFVSAITTLGLIFLPRLYQPVSGFEERMALTQNPAYVLRSWVYLLHPFLVVTAALAVAARCRFRAGGAASLGFLGFGLWGATEAAQQTLTLVALDRTWRAAWTTADETQRSLIRGYVATYDALWDSLYLLLLLGFFAGNVFLAIATRAHPGMARWVSIAYVGGAAVTLLNLSPELGGPQLETGATAWLYPAIQPAGRALTGLWLWREAEHERSMALPSAGLT